MTRRKQGGKAALVLTVTVLVATALALAVPAPVTNAAGDDASVWDVTGAKPVPCRDLSTELFPSIDGGCLARVPSIPVKIAVLTPFGPLSMGRCGFDLDLQIGPDGDAWLQGLTFRGRRHQVCGDLRPCWNDDKKRLPWKGKIARAGDGRFEIAFDMCLNTCIGRFEGKLPFDLIRDRRGWRMRADEAVAGESGFALEGDWRLVAVNLGPPTDAYFKRAGRGAAGFDLR